MISEAAGTNADVVDLVDRALADIDPIVAAVGADAYDRPTPCSEFDVRALLAHVVGGLRSFAVVGEGGPMLFDTDPDLASEDALGEYRSAGVRLLKAWRAPGTVEGAYAMPWGESTGAQLLGFTLIEVLTHGWDLARACGLTRTIDPDLAEAALASARSWVDDSTRVPPLFGPEVPIADDAPAGDRLAAFLGHHV